MVELQGTYSHVIEPITKVCPQGSILGPDLWNLVLNGLLRRLETSNCTFAAYADDLIILLHADTRLNVCDLVHQWLHDNHLQL